MSAIANSRTAAEERRRGYVIEVVRRKIPWPSQIVYIANQDACPLARLPLRSGR